MDAVKHSRKDMDIFAQVMEGDFRGYANLVQSTDINAKDEDGTSLLRLAIAFGGEDIAHDLLSRGIEINQIDGKGSNELQNAFWQGFWSLGRELIERGADLHHRNKHGNNALWYASTHPRPDYDLIRLLVEKGSDVSTKNKAGRSPLDAARERGNAKLLEILESGQSK